MSRLARFIELEWIRNRKMQSMPKHLPHKIGYVRRLPDELVLLDLIADRMIKGQSPFLRRPAVSTVAELDPVEG